MIRRPPRSTQSRSSAASDVYKRQGHSLPQSLSWRTRLLAATFRISISPQTYTTKRHNTARHNKTTQHNTPQHTTRQQQQPQQHTAISSQPPTPRPRFIGTTQNIFSYWPVPRVAHTLSYPHPTPLLSAAADGHTVQGQLRAPHNGGIPVELSLTSDFGMSSPP